MLPFRSGRSWKRGAVAAFLLVGILGSALLAAGPEKSPGASKASPKAKQKSTPVPGGIPLPIGHEIKGLVLPDYDVNGQLQAKFEAAVAKRIDADRVQFKGLKVTTYTPENTPDLAIDMPSSMLDLNTRIVTSQERTTISRADFTIVGDTLSFDTSARQGTLTGNVKMVILDQAHFIGNGKRGK